MLRELLQVPETDCPRCGKAQVAWNERSWRGRTMLLLTRLFSRLIQHLLPLQLRCKGCADCFDHLHVLPRTVVGYHGCRQDFARKLVAGGVSTVAWKMSQNEYDWLGEG